MAFCLKAEEFVDDKLSNWYVRRNRRRFWKSEKGADKLAAYQTLYTVLTTLTKLFAPIMPFLSETMYQNLASPAASAPGDSGAYATRLARRAFTSAISRSPRICPATINFRPTWTHCCASSRSARPRGTA